MKTKTYQISNALILATVEDLMVNGKRITKQAIQNHIDEALRKLVCGGNWDLLYSGKDMDDCDYNMYHTAITGGKKITKQDVYNKASKYFN